VTARSQVTKYGRKQQRTEQPPAEGTANHVSSDLGFVNVNSFCSSTNVSSKAATRAVNMNMVRP
jgi:hypothetical protein